MLQRIWPWFDEVQRGKQDYERGGSGKRQACRC
jgi:hypothetical protein